MESSFGLTDRDDGVFVIFRGDKISYSSELRSQTGMGVFGKNKMGGTERTGFDSNTNKSLSKASTLKMRASAKTKRVIEYPIFDTMMNQEQDPYWKSLFDDAAVGKFPRNFKFQNGSLYYKIRSKTLEHPIESDSSTNDLLEMIQAVKQFFLVTAGILSPEDLRRKKLEEEKRILELMNNEVVSWKQIRSEKQRMIMLSLYVEKIGKKYGLSVEERKGLVQNIRIGMLAGYFHNDNISIIGNRIEEIEGLCFNEDTKEFYIDKESNKPVLPKGSRDFDSKAFWSHSSNDPSETLQSEDSEDSDSEEKTARTKHSNTYDFTTFSSRDVDDSKSSSQYEKKKWNRFLSEISKKGK